MGKKIAIIGGVAGGASALARLRRLDEDAEIVLFERGEYVSFANCGLPYYIGGTIENRDSLLVQTPEGIMERFNVDVRIKSEVTKIIKEDKKVLVKNLQNNETYEETYDYLILSPGSTPLKPPIPGIESPNIFSLWNIPDTDTIKSYIDEKKPKTAIVVGGGFIGLEMAENLHELGLKVSIVEMLDQVMAPIDYEMAQIVHEHLKLKGVDLRLKDGVSKFEYKDGVTTITLQSGATVEGDMIILSIGIRPNGELAKEAGLEVNQRGGVVVDRYLRTDDDFIYAIGDVIEVKDYVNKNQTMIPLAGPANKQGRIVANNILGEKNEYKGTQGTSIAKVFDIAVASTGTNEKTLNRLGKEYKKDYLISVIHANSNAGYYPGALPMTIKLIFDLEGKVLGSQIVGYEGVDKRIDVIATAIRFGGSVADLAELELAYAPPYSSAKDPVNMIGFVAENQLKKKVDVILWRELQDLDMEDNIILDVREEEELQIGCIEGAINIPLGQLRERLGELDKSKSYVLYCAVGLRGYIATRILSQNGFQAKNLAGGFTTYKNMYLQDDNGQEGGEDQKGPQGFSDSGVQKVEKKTKESEPIKTRIAGTGDVFKLNACGLSCPGPIVQVNENLKNLNDGDILEVMATDPGFLNDIKAWCKNTGNTLIKTENADKKFIALIEKRSKAEKQFVGEVESVKDGKNIIVFSGDLDKAIASFIIANGARAMDKDVTMFFTFWGLNIIKKQTHVKTNKNFMAKMFSMMLPKNSKKLSLSKMNMAGMGPKMIRMVMKGKNISSLEELIEEGMKSGIKMVACQMSMDVMGVSKEELLEGVEIGGVATMLDASDDSNMSLFI
ncbi:FAD-dependent oxidoreductase [Tissierella sp.]|uniref:FAD-dependent oxidoreductase n=1 Tax=Tissierella sp. TaxID=41274 RepID=UPI002861E2B6|nr:FAD-dependent oxidoreductase [Tissierella sp.]MDR7857694.1 FAD-dependent oxidoreductase [Tissierella sp.]